ncbi:MAG: hypothetical protein ACT4PI_04215 [Actinomycetota bacterium]
MTTAALALARPPITKSACAPRRVGAAGLVALAAVVHAALTPAHFDEGLVFGVAFVVMTVLQGTVAVALLARPGSHTDALARQSSLVLVALYLLTRVVPVPGSTEPEDATPIGALAVVLEVAALLVLARLPRDRPPRLSPVSAGIVAEFATLVAVLLATGSLRWVPGDLSSEYAGPAPVLEWVNRGWSVSSPIITLYVTNHLVLYASVLTLALTAALAFEVGVGVARSRQKLLAGGTERRHLYWAPAFLAAPVCCGAPLLGVVGPAAFAALLRYSWVPLTVAVALGALSLARGSRPMRDRPPRRASSESTTGRDGFEDREPTAPTRGASL